MRFWIVKWSVKSLKEINNKGLTILLKQELNRLRNALCKA